MSEGEERVLAFICHPYHRGGVTRWMVDMAIDCASQGTNVYFVTVEPKNDFFSAGGKETIVSLLSPHKNVRLITAKAGWEFELGTEPYRANVYVNLLLAHVPLHTPVILSDDPGVWRVASLAVGRYNFIGVLHSDEPKYYELAKAYYDQVAALVCVSSRIKEKLLNDNTGIDGNRVSVIPCGIQLPGGVQRRYEAGKLRLIFTGRITEYQKRVSDLLKIGLKLSEKKHDFVLKIIGDGSDRKTLEQEVIQSGLQENIIFYGWLSKDEIYDQLYQSDLLLLTSDFEGMPIAVMEGLSAGCGIISTRVSGVEDYEPHPLAKNCLWLNKVGDVMEAVNNIEKSLSIPAKDRQNSAINLAEEEFSMEACISKYYNVIKTIKKHKGDLNHQPTNWTINIYSFSLSVVRYIKYRLTQ